MQLFLFFNLDTYRPVIEINYFTTNTRSIGLHNLPEDSVTDANNHVDRFLKHFILLLNFNIPLNFRWILDLTKVMTAKVIYHIHFSQSTP